MKTQQLNEKISPSTTWQMAAHDAFTAALEIGLATADAIGIRHNEPSGYLQYLWSRVQANHYRLRETEQSFFTLPGIDTLGKIAAGKALGHRLVVIGSGSISELLPRSNGRPYVVLWVGDTVPDLPTDQHFFMLVAYSVQELVDLSLIAIAMAETLLIPGVVYFQTNKFDPDLQPVAWPSSEVVNQFLGKPDDEIPTPLEIQKESFGETRRRVPIHLPQSVLLPGAGDIHQIFHTISKQFAQISGREYSPLKASRSSETVIFTVNRFVNRSDAMLPILLHPFPWREFSTMVKGTPWIGVVASPRNITGLLEMVETAMDRAFSRREGAPIFSKSSDRPVIVTIETRGDFIQWEELLPQIKKHYKKQVRFSAPLQQDNHPQPGEKTRIQIQFFAENSLSVVRRVAQMIHLMNGWSYRVVGDTLGQAFNLLLHPTEIPDEKAETDVLFTPDLFDGLSDAVLHVREGGSLILPGHPEAAELVWQKLPENVRQTILDRKITVYLINLDVVTGDRWEENTITAVFLASIMKVLHDRFQKEFANVSLPEALPKSNNCHIDFAELYRRAFDGTRAVDAELITRYTPPVLEEKQEGFQLPAPDQTRSLDSELYRDYLAFHLTGHYLECPKWPYRTRGLVHPLIKAFQDPDQFRYDFPVCLLKNSEEPARPLREVVDKVIANVQLDGEQKAQFEHDVLLAEKEIKRLVAAGYEKPLEDLWEMAVSGILHDVGVEKESAKVMSENFARARSQFPETVEVIGASPNFPLKLFNHVWRMYWEHQSARYKEEVNRLLIGLTEILRLDDSKSPVAHEPERLKATVGEAYQEELNFEALSDIIEKTHLEGEPLPTERRTRIEQALGLVKLLYQLFEQPNNGDAWNPLLPNPWQVKETNQITTAIGEYQAQLHFLLRLFRAVHIARLEVENQYKPQKHDAIFNQFGFENLSSEELGMIPPLLLAVTSDRLSESEREVLNEVLLSKLPVRVLLITRNLCSTTYHKEDVPCAGNWVLRMGFRALAQDQPFVLQSSAANVSLLSQGFLEGLAAKRPALFSVFAGDNRTFYQLSNYLVWAGATEARMFPTFKYNPEASDTWADRFSIEGNPRVETLWSASDVPLADGESENLTLHYTPADYLVHDARFASHFQLLPAELEDDRIVPLIDYVNLPQTDRQGKLPFIYLADAQGNLHRVLVTLAMVEAVETIARHWRLIQEWGGIGNSLVAKALEQARAEMEADKAREIEALTEQFQAEMEKTVGQVAEEIVSNIAAGLLGQAAIQPVAPSTTVAPPSAAPAETPVEPAEQATEEAPPTAEEEEEETLSFDEPYIETPRCTSCGECIAINSQMFAYNDNKQAYIKDASAGTYRELVMAAEKCPVHIIHPGKPKNPDEPHLDEWVERAKPYL